MSTHLSFTTKEVDDILKAASDTFVTPEMFGAKGDGEVVEKRQILGIYSTDNEVTWNSERHWRQANEIVGTDDSEAFEKALRTGKKVICDPNKIYYFDKPIDLSDYARGHLDANGAVLHGFRIFININWEQMTWKTAYSAGRFIIENARIGASPWSVVPTNYELPRIVAGCPMILRNIECGYPCLLAVAEEYIDFMQFENIVNTFNLTHVVYNRYKEALDGEYIENPGTETVGDYKVKTYYSNYSPAIDTEGKIKWDYIRTTPIKDLYEMKLDAVSCLLKKSTVDRDTEKFKVTFSTYTKEFFDKLLSFYNEINQETIKNYFEEQIDKETKITTWVLKEGCDLTDLKNLIPDLSLPYEAEELKDTAGNVIKTVYYSKLTKETGSQGDAWRVIGCQEYCGQQYVDGYHIGRYHPAKFIGGDDIHIKYYFMTVTDRMPMVFESVISVAVVLSRSARVQFLGGHWEQEQVTFDQDSNYGGQVLFQNCYFWLSHTLLDSPYVTYDNCQFDFSVTAPDRRRNFADMTGNKTWTDLQCTLRNCQFMSEHNVDTQTLKLNKLLPKRTFNLNSESAPNLTALKFIRVTGPTNNTAWTHNPPFAAWKPGWFLDLKDESNSKHGDNEIYCEYEYNLYSHATSSPTIANNFSRGTTIVRPLENEAWMQCVVLATGSLQERESDDTGDNTSALNKFISGVKGGYHFTVFRQLIKPDKTKGNLFKAEFYLDPTESQLQDIRFSFIDRGTWAEMTEYIGTTIKSCIPVPWVDLGRTYQYQEDRMVFKSTLTEANGILMQSDHANNRLHEGLVVYNNELPTLTTKRTIDSPVTIIFDERESETPEVGIRGIINARTGLVTRLSGENTSQICIEKFIPVEKGRKISFWHIDDPSIGVSQQKLVTQITVFEYRTDNLKDENGNETKQYNDVYIRAGTLSKGNEYGIDSHQLSNETNFIRISTYMTVSGDTEWDELKNRIIPRIQIFYTDEHPGPSSDGDYTGYISDKVLDNNQEPTSEDRTVSLEKTVLDLTNAVIKGSDGQEYALTVDKDGKLSLVKLSDTNAINI